MTPVPPDRPAYEPPTEPPFDLGEADAAYPTEDEVERVARALLDLPVTAVGAEERARELARAAISARGERITPEEAVEIRMVLLGAGKLGPPEVWDPIWAKLSRLAAEAEEER